MQWKRLVSRAHPGSRRSVGSAGLRLHRIGAAADHGRAFQRQAGRRHHVRRAFTSSGHFIVLRGVKDEKILVADPASRTRSEQSWELSIILNEASKAAGSGGPFWIM